MKKLMVLLGMLGLTITAFAQTVEMKRWGDAAQIKTAIEREQREGANRQLLLAAETGELEKVVEAIQAGADINATNDKGSTALMIAVVCEHPSIAYYLLNEAEVNGVRVKPDVNIQNENGATVLHAAASTGDKDMVRMLVQAGADVTVKGPRSLDALWRAYLAGHMDVVKYLLEECNADVETTDGIGSTLLISAVSDREEAFIKYLIEERHVSVAYINKTVADSDTALDFAETYFPEITDYLISKGALHAYEVSR